MVFSLRLVKGRRPRNGLRYAGKVFIVGLPGYPNGVWFSWEGFPDFSPYAKATVVVDGLTGVYNKDAAMANK